MSDFPTYNQLVDVGDLPSGLDLRLDVLLHQKKQCQHAGCTKRVVPRPLVLLRKGYEVWLQERLQDAQRGKVRKLTRYCVDCWCQAQEYSGDRQSPFEDHQDQERWLADNAEGQTQLPLSALTLVDFTQYKEGQPPAGAEDEDDESEFYPFPSNLDPQLSQLIARLQQKLNHKQWQCKAFLGEQSAPLPKNSSALMIALHKSTRSG